MTGFKPGSSCIGNNHAANCATTTAHFSEFISVVIWQKLLMGKFSMQVGKGQIYLSIWISYSNQKQCFKIYRQVNLCRKFLHMIGSSSRCFKTFWRKSRFHQMLEIEKSLVLLLLFQFWGRFSRFPPKNVLQHPLQLTSFQTQMNCITTKEPVFILHTV